MEYFGLNIKTSENVYAPAEDTLLAAELIESGISMMGNGLRVLDVGAGTGILGLVAARFSNVGEVVFADSSQGAVDLCMENVDANRSRLRANCTVMKGSLFEKVRGDFDLIIFNAPYLPDNDNIALSESWYGGEGGVELSIKFLRDSLPHIKRGGHIVIVESSFGDLYRLRSEMQSLGFRVENEKRVHIAFEDIIAMLLVRESGTRA